MIIKLDNASKSFNYQVIFKDLNLELSVGKTYAILGQNGSGKSTLLKSLVGFNSISKGKLSWFLEGKEIHQDNFYSYFNFLSPYSEIIEDLTLLEFLQFNFKFSASKITVADIISKLGFEKQVHKELKYFSSGMKQRVKLATVFYSKKPVLILDEPTSNLDVQGKKWYKSEIKKLMDEKDKLILIASNDPDEYSMCDEIINISSYK